MKLVMTYELAMAAAKDAANEHMRLAGRERWNEDDYNHMWCIFELLWPVDADKYPSRCLPVE